MKRVVNLTDNIIYANRTEAGKSVGLKDQSISKAIKEMRYAGGKLWMYYDVDKLKEFQRLRDEFLAKYGEEDELV